MKARTVILSLTITAAIAAGSIYGVYQYSVSHRTPVEVMLVESANIGSWFYDDGDSDSTLEGTLYTRNTQTVNRDTQYSVTEVYVQAGDEVKIGDPLMEYDMTLQELKLEREQITRTSYEISLKKTQDALAKFKANPNSSSYYEPDDLDLDDDDDDSDDTASAPVEAEPEETLDDAGQSETTSGDESGTTDILSGDENGSTDTLSGDESGPTDTLSGDESGSTDTPSGDEGGTTDISSGDESGSSGTSSGDESGSTDTSSDTSSGDGTAQTETASADDTSSDVDLFEDPDDAQYGSDDDELIDDGQLIEIDTFTDDDTVDDDLIYSLDGSNQLLFLLTEFRTLENRLGMIYEETPEDLDKDSIDQALSIFREDLTAVPSETDGTIIKIAPDVFGKTRTVNLYRISDGLIDVLGDTFLQEDGSTDEMRVYRQVERVYTAYLNVLYYDLVYQMEAINDAMEKASVTASSISDELVRSLSGQIESAVTAWYAFDQEWEAISQLLMQDFDYTQEQIDELYEKNFKERVESYLGQETDIMNAAAGILPVLAARLNELGVVEETEPATESISEDMSEDLTEWDDFDDGYDDGWGDSSANLTQAEIQEQIRAYEESISELELAIRESEIKIRKYERILDKQTVTATINGIVKQAGAASGGSSSNFIVITGEEGMYVTCNVNELKRESVAIGDLVTGTDYETGLSFVGVVTEVSEYPSSSESSSYYWWSSESDNPNASFYPVTAYIENADGLSEGNSVSVSIAASGASASSAGVYLESYFVRTDRQGRSYVYVRGEDGLLEKRYVKTGSGLWGYGIQVKSGLSNSDYIAFPYGKNVIEGAPTEEVDSLDGY